MFGSHLSLLNYYTKFVIKTIIVNLYYYYFMFCFSTILAI